MRTFLAALTCLMLFATPVVAGDWEDAEAASKAGDYQKAFRLFRSLAEQGYSGAQYRLGVMYANGFGVPEDDAKAVHWFRKAAEQGYVASQLILGVMYANGEGIPEDDAKAVHWYRKAAEQGDVVSQFKLGWMYHKGEGVLEDYVQAYAWWSIAATRGFAAAKRNNDIIKKEMTREQISEAQKLSSEY